jgi:hypothetical protein
LLAAASALATAATVAAKRTALANGTSATLTYRSHSPVVLAQRVTIKHFGEVLYDEPVSAGVCGRNCSPSPFTGQGAPLRVLDLESDGQPDVLLSLYSGGAHCCIIDQVFTLDPGTMTYVKHEHDFADAGATVKQLGTPLRYRFISADESFAYRFTDFAHSGLPVQIWRFDGRNFDCVTRSYPAQIRADAARWLRAFTHNSANGVGFIAAWAADEDMLGNSALVRSTLEAAADKGALRSGDSGLPAGARFVRALQKFLRAHAYTHC